MVAGRLLPHKTWRLTSYKCINIHFLLYNITILKEMISFCHIFAHKNKDLMKRM